MDDIAFSDWPGQPVDLSSSNPWLPAYGYQPPSTLLDKDDFIGNPDAALFLHGSSGPHYVFLETIMEETSDDLRSESDRSGSRASPVGWLATDSESGSVIHVDLNGIDEIDSGSESEIACPAKRRRQDPNLLPIPVMYSDTDSNHSLSRSSSLLQFENLEKSCQEGYSSSPSILSLYSQDSLEQQRKTNDLSPDSLERCHSDSESESDYYKTLKIDVPKSKRYRDSLFYNTKRLSDSDSKSDSDSQDSDETLQVASRSNSCKSVQNLKACRSFDSLNVATKGSTSNNKKDKMSAENLSEDSGYSDHLCNYMKNKSSSIPNMQVQGIIIPEKSTNKVPNELKKVNARTLEDMNSFRLKNIKVEGFDAYDGEPCFQNFASHFGSSYQDLTMFDRYETLTSSFKPTLIDRFMLTSKRSGGNAVNPDYRVPQTDVLNIGSPVECVATSKINNSTAVTASASEPNLFQPAVDAASSIAATTRSCCLLDKTQVHHCKQDYFEASVCVSSVPKDLNLAGESKQFEEYTWSFNTTSIAAKNWDIADLPAEPNLNFTDNFNENAALTEVLEDKMAANIYRQEGSNVTATIRHLTEDLENKMAANIYRQEGSNVTASMRQEESSSLSSGGSDISMPRYRREGSYVKAISDYLDVTDEEQEKSYQEPLDTILDIESQVQKAISESSIQSFNDDQEKLDMFFHSTPINKRNVTSTPNLSSLNCEKQLFDVIQTNDEIRRSMQNMPRKSSLIDRSASTSGMSDDDKTLTSKNFNGSGSTAKGVHFCPIVSEVSWKDSSSSEDISSFSVSSDPHDSTPEPEDEPPRELRTPVRKSSSQPELPKAGENETDFIFIPLNPQKWASSTPSVATTRQNQNGNATKTDRGASTTITIMLKSHDGSADVYKAPPTGRHVNQQQQQCSSSISNSVVELEPVPAPFNQQSKQQQAVVVMDSPIAHRPVIPPAKQTRTAKLGGFLSRFASFRFSTRKSSEAKDKKKNEAKKKIGEPNIVKLAEPQTRTHVATEKDYIYIPLKGPLPPGFSSAQTDLNGGRKHINTTMTTTTTTSTTKVLVDGREVTDGDFSKVNGSSRQYRDQQQQVQNPKERLDVGAVCISAKPPLPKLPPRVVSACVKKRTETAHSVPHSPSAALRTLRDIDSGVGGAPRNASSMEPMGLIETDLDTEVTVITGGTGAHVKTRSLMNLGGAEPPPQGRRQLLTATENANRPHKSMEFLLDKQNLKAVEPPENELQKGTGERVMSEHQLRVQRSLQKLTVPDWYKHNQVPREGFILKKHRNEPRWTGTGTANNSKTPSLSSLGSGHSPVLLSPTPHGQTQPFTRWSTSKLNSAASSPCASTRSSFNHRTSNGGISPCSVRSSFSYRQPYLGWRSQERLTRPRTPAERLATSLLPAVPVDNIENPEIQTSIKEVTSAIVHYVSGLKPDIHDRNSLSPTSSPRLGRESVSPRFKGYESQDTASQRSASPQSRGSQKLCWLESSFVGTRPLDSPQTPVSLTSETANQQAPPTTLRLDLQKNINNEMISHMMESTNRPSPSSTTLEDVLDSLLGLPPSTRAPSPSLQETASASTSPSKLAERCVEHYRRRSEGSEPSSRPVTAVSSEAPRRVSFHASPSSDANNSAAATVKCRYSRCGKVTVKLSDTGKKYKNCHNCTYIYCSRECRRAHWEKHRMTCLFSRVGALCRQVLAAAKENLDTLKMFSLLARQGFLGQSNGAVKCFFSSPEHAEKFIAGNTKALGEPVYVPWTDLLPSEMGPNLYSDLIRMCKTYNPDTRFVLYVSVCVVSEVPATGAVKWERQLVSRCAKIRLCKTVISTITPSTKLDRNSISSSTKLLSSNEPKTVILTAPCTNDMSVQKSREVSFACIQRQLRQRGISLKRQFPEVHQKLGAYVEGKCDKFAPITIYPKDFHTGKSFMCIITPDIAQPDKLKLKLPTDSPRSNKPSDVD